MFLDFFQELKHQRVPISVTEWLTMMGRLERGGNFRPTSANFTTCHGRFLVKDEAYYDKFDRAFLAVFRGMELPGVDLEAILEGLASVEPKMPTEDILKQLQDLGLDKVLENFFEQLRQQHYKNHVGGNKAIGRGGTSTQGSDGYNPAGVRVGQASGRHRKAIQIAEYRRFKPYDDRRVLDTRSMQAALRRLRKLLPAGPVDELDIDKTIDETARNAGEIELVYRRREIPAARVVLMMDVGGSMEPFADLVSRLFSASKNQIRDLKHFYFHNCVYDDLWEDAQRYRPIPTQEVIDKYSKNHWLIMIGDAAMSPYELSQARGSIDLMHRNARPGHEWLQELRNSFDRSVWLNPEPENQWDWTLTIRQIGQIFRMEELTLDGLERAVMYLRAKSPRQMRADMR